VTETVTDSAPRSGYVVSKIAYSGEYGPELDLGLATSPIGAYPEVLESIQSILGMDELSVYDRDPYSHESGSLVVSRYELENVTSSDVIFHPNGSYGMGDEMVRFLSSLGYSRILVTPYSFPNVAEWAKRHSVAYIPLPVDGNGLCDSYSYLMKMDPTDLNRAIVYLDCPNNPTGLADVATVIRVMEYIQECGAIPMLDVAFGEVLMEDCSRLMQCAVDCGGVAIGSLSKVQGLPSVRAGMAVMNNSLACAYNQGGHRLVFTLTGLQKTALNYLYRPHGNNGACIGDEQAQRVADYCYRTNSSMIPALERLGLTILQTDLRTPIQVIVASVMDLYQRLARVGIKTESLQDYQVTLGERLGYGNSAVRLVTPGLDQLDEVIRRIKIALSF